jgi:ectoine hydroxylase-related dioxygenase (phytanoyl-CoA dioxygenase family)
MFTNAQRNALTAMTMSEGALPKLEAGTEISIIADTLLEHGGIVVENFLSADQLSRFNAELQPFIDAPDGKEQAYVNEGFAAFYGPAMRHVLAVAGKSDVFVNEILCHPIYLGLGDRILKASCQRYQLNVAHVLERMPGAKAQVLHRDHVVWPDLGPLHPNRQISSVIALSEFTADMGATLVVPGSHKWEPGRRPKRHEIFAAEMKPGSAVVYLGGTIHAGGANTTTDRNRRGMHVSFCLGWLRTEENNYLSISLERVRKLSPLAQTLLGYAAHDGLCMGLGYLGAVDLADPVELFAQGKL